MKLIEIRNLEQKGIEVYSSLTEHQLRHFNKESGIFIAESPKVIRLALEAGYQPLSLLCEKKHIEGDARDIIENNPELQVFTGSREILSQLTGYTLTRGVLCAMKRKPIVSAESICRQAKRIAVIDSVCDTTNIGSIFRSAAALGVDGILLTPETCDPLNRRSVRVSMGTVFKVAWSYSTDALSLLKENGFTTVALALKPDSIPIDHPSLQEQERLALVLGGEGYGLSDRMIELCDYSAIIPMYRKVDSLNVGVAAAIAFWQFRRPQSDI